MRTYGIDDDGDGWQFYLRVDGAQVGGGLIDDDGTGNGYLITRALCEAFVRADDLLPIPAKT